MSRINSKFVINFLGVIITSDTKLIYPVYKWCDGNNLKFYSNESNNNSKEIIKILMKYIYYKCM